MMNLLTKIERQDDNDKNVNHIAGSEKKIYVKAKADKLHRFWGLYVHVCKQSTLEEAYRIVKRNNGAPGITE